MLFSRRDCWHGATPQLEKLKKYLELQGSFFLLLKRLSNILQDINIFYLIERLEQVATRHRQSNVDVVHDEKRLILGLVREAGQVVCYKQQHVHLCFLLVKKAKTKPKNHFDIYWKTQKRCFA